MLRPHQQRLEMLKQQERLQRHQGCVCLLLSCLWMWIPMSWEMAAAHLCCSTWFLPVQPGQSLGALWGPSGAALLLHPPALTGGDSVRLWKSNSKRLAGQTPTASSGGVTWSPSKVTKMGRISHLIWFICYNDSSPRSILNTSVIFASKTLLQGS